MKWDKDSKLFLPQPEDSMSIEEYRKRKNESRKKWITANKEEYLRKKREWTRAYRAAGKDRELNERTARKKAEAEERKNKRMLLKAIVQEMKSYE